MPTLDRTMENQVRPRPRAETRRRSQHVGADRGPATAPRGIRRLTGGGTEGNERLTVLTGLVLIVVFAALGITILRIGQLLWLHFFLGLLLLGPVALKLASTGYRFVRYYTRNQRYRVKGPPPPILRLMAPALVGLTLVVFASGIVLMFIGPSSSLRNDVFLVHKVSFILWVVLFGLHILGHLPEVFRLLRISSETRRQIIAARSGRDPRSAVPVEPSIHEHLPGGTGRWLSLSVALVVGLVLAVVLIPNFGVWTNNVAVTLHHHHHG